MSRLTASQTPPERDSLTAGPCVQDMVINDLLGQTLPNLGLIRDIEERKASGLRTYGTLLEVLNGRDAGIDLYQELLDALQYAKQGSLRADSQSEICELTYHLLLPLVEVVREKLVQK